ncbi:MAG TPA: hypothetical protein VFW07_21130 [Parafilimonas sp.]|nr:hypothetical protein [Parafilimonas sp.]
MALTNSLLLIVKNKFPEHAQRIEALFSAEDDFRALCLDYVLCLEYLQKFKNESQEKKLCVKEYKDVRAALENELSQFILNGLAG